MGRCIKAAGFAARVLQDNAAATKHQSTLSCSSSKRPPPFPMQLLYFDTEGFESTGKADVYDDRIFALSAVISQVLIYNLPESIRESDLEKLSFAVELAKAFYSAEEVGWEVAWWRMQCSSWDLSAESPYQSLAFNLCQRLSLLFHLTMHASTRVCRPMRQPRCSPAAWCGSSSATFCRSVFVLCGGQGCCSHIAVAGARGVALTGQLVLAERQRLRPASDNQSRLRVDCKTDTTRRYTTSVH
jgi:hypothetical protein